MLLFDLLKLWEPTFTASKAKVHLARHNGKEHSLDVFLVGKFDAGNHGKGARTLRKSSLCP